MRKFIQKHSQKIFTASILTKAGIGVVEIIVGVFFYFVSYATLNRLADVFIYSEIAEDPDSIFLKMLGSGFQSLFAYSKLFWAFLLIAHGVVKVFLIHGLLRNKRWSYLVSAIVFSYFILDQTRRFFSIPSIFLGLITLFDILVVFLILFEYRKRFFRNEK